VRQTTTSKLNFYRHRKGLSQAEGTIRHENLDSSEDHPEKDHI